MPFSPDERLVKVYDVIKSECRKLGLKAARADEFVGAHRVIDQITDNIYNCEFIVCDLSEERPNIYYELGFAHAAGNGPNDILLIAREGTILHFDIAALRVRFYRDTRQLRSILANDLAEMIRLTRGRRVSQKRAKARKR